MLPLKSFVKIFSFESARPKKGIKIFINLKPKSSSLNNVQKSLQKLTQRTLFTLFWYQHLIKKKNTSHGSKGVPGSPKSGLRGCKLFFWKTNFINQKFFFIKGHKGNGFQIFGPYRVKWKKGYQKGEKGGGPFLKKCLEMFKNIDFSF